MMLNEVTAQAGGRRRRKRVGRGESSGRGKTSGRGHKGVQSRAGGGTRPLTEGGQMPLFRRLPKRGFSNFNFRTAYVIVNIGTLSERFDDGGTVDLDALRKLRLVRGREPLVRVLAKGKLDKKLTVHAHAFSQKARQLIEQAGGSVHMIARLDRAEAAAKKRRTAGRKGTAAPAQAEPAAPPATAPQDES